MVMHRYLRVPYTLSVHEFQKPKRPKATYVFIHGIGNNAHAWDEVVAKLPKDVRIIGVDLLGFGKSAKPEWAVYDAKTQAKSLGITLLGLRLAHQPILVGHSLGALVAIEMAKRYGLVVRKLVLCSPPFYKPEIKKSGLVSADDVLRQLYRTAKKYPERFEKMSPLAVKLGLANKSFSVTTDNRHSYFAALEASVINQTALVDVAELKIPVHILYGAFDPVVIKKHISRLAKKNDHITAQLLPVGHEVVGSYAKALAARLKQDLE